MRVALLMVLVFVALLWVVEAVNLLVDHRLNDYGILPRTRSGLVGIPLAPLLHGGFGHLASNTVPLLMLGGLAAVQGSAALLRAVSVIVLAGGLGVWVAGRSSIHVGASGLVFGLFAYLVGSGWYRRSIATVAVALVVLFFYWGLILGVLPAEESVSWESHLFGLLAGLLAARLSRGQARVTTPRPSWNPGLMGTFRLRGSVYNTWTAPREGVDAR